jgi:hypothetical protein
MKHTNMLFFTYANKAYDLFALPYAYFALTANPGSMVEIILEDAEDFHKKYKDGISLLNEIFPERALFRQSASIQNGLKCKPHVVRFLEEPLTSAEYIYIGDIDILILENVYETHTHYIKENNIPFSNIIRTGTESTKFPRLTGLHFCKMEKMYPLPDISDININERNDENVLYEIMRRKGIMVPTSFRNRPMCGIHVSLNRDSIGRYSVNRGDQFLVGETFNWGITKYKDIFLKILSESSFNKIFFQFSLEYRALLMVIESVAKDELRKLNRISSEFLVDKRLSATIRNAKRLELIEEARAIIANGENYQGLSLLNNIINIWPNDFDTYILLSTLYFELNDKPMAVECLLHANDLSLTPRDFKKVSEIVEKHNILLKSHEPSVPSE